MTTEIDNVPRVKLADAPSLPARVRDQLRGRVTDPGWLPAELDPAVDDARARHLELLATTAAALDALRAERARWGKQDREHAERLRVAVRDGKPEPADERSTAEQRKAAEARLAERVVAALEVLSEHIANCVQIVRKAEDDILAGLRQQADDAREQRRQAEELLASARRAEWKIKQTAAWVIQTADGLGAFGGQPAPLGKETPPAQFVG